jgi:hypothetical protein
MTSGSMPDKWFIAVGVSVFVIFGIGLAALYGGRRP